MNDETRRNLIMGVVVAVALSMIAATTVLRGSRSPPGGFPASGAPSAGEGSSGGAELPPLPGPGLGCWIDETGVVNCCWKNAAGDVMCGCMVDMPCGPSTDPGAVPVR